MSNEDIYDCAIIGGGLAGLTLAINLCRQKYKIILFEKEEYPFHKVCGEYISLESKEYLESLGLSLKKLNVPVIKKLLVTAPDGNELKHDLPLGGFGISRYKLDNELKNIAVKSRANILENCKVDNVLFDNNTFIIQTTKASFKSRLCCGSFGKRSNLDIKWKRAFVSSPPNKLNNFIAIKYHVQATFPADTIALHNFKDGYCGLSKIEDDKYCLCYLTNAANLHNNENSVDKMERAVLSKNPHLKNIFEHCTRLYSSPLSISQISFQQKKPVENHILMIGDAAGMIAPLCGNGMSMAMHAGKIASGFIHQYLQGNLSRAQMEKLYTQTWKKTFGKRLRTGRVIQRFFGKPGLTNIFIRIMKSFPSFTSWLIRQTHGRPF